MDFSTQKLVFVTGKGGVGKSLTAASIAFAESKKGRKVCLVELGAHSFYDSFFQTRGLGYEPQEIFTNFHVALLNPEESLREYITHYIKVAKLYDLLFENRVTKSFISAAPGASEISLLGKLTSDIRKVGPQSDYDLYVVDCYSTGHAMALLRAPRGIATAVRMGPLGDQSRDISNVLRMRDKVAYVIVTLAEEMPLRESLELTQLLRNEFSEEIRLVCNRLLVPPVSLDEINSFGKKRAPGLEDARDFVEFLQFKLQQQQEAHVLLKDTGLPLYAVPLLTESCETNWSPEIFMKTVGGFLEKQWI